MPVALPPELVHHVLDSAPFPPNDLAHIALASRNFLPFARHNLYHSIEVIREPGSLGVIMGNWRTGSASFGYRRYIPFVYLNARLPVHRFVKEVRMNGDNLRLNLNKGSVKAIETVLDALPSVETLILDHWPYLSSGVSKVVVGHQNRRAEDQKLSVYMRASFDCFDDEIGQFQVPMAYFDASTSSNYFDPTALAASKFCLLGLGFDVTYRALYRDFPNTTVLRLNFADVGCDNLVLQLLEIFDYFPHLQTLALGGLYRTRSTLDSLLHFFSQHLPSSLRSLSLECDYNEEEAAKLVQALPTTTTLKRFTFRPIHDGSSVSLAISDIAGRTRGALEITSDEYRELWEDLCMFRPLY
ncbi:hypothetical protein JCM5353_002522 [Sporobolomyces roseus]